MASARLSDARIRDGYVEPGGVYLRRQADQTIFCQAAACTEREVGVGANYDVLVRKDDADRELPFDVTVCERCARRAFDRGGAKAIRVRHPERKEGQDDEILAFYTLGRSGTPATSSGRWSRLLTRALAAQKSPTWREAGQRRELEPDLYREALAPSHRRRVDPCRRFVRGLCTHAQCHERRARFVIE
jgi:hypothetical protein